MEAIKVSPKVEFDVIYADGERKRVPEGVLFGVEEDNSMVIYNGTDCSAVLKKLAEEVHRRIWLNTPATFRLGQMDFQQCAADMLEDVAKNAEDGLVSSAFLQAAALVRGMDIPGGE